MKTIIAAVDFSEASENAAMYAARLSVEMHAALILFHTYQYPAMIGDVPYPAEAYRYVFEDAEAAINQLAQSIEKKLDGRRVAHIELREGNFIRQLEDLCEERKPDVVVMGCNGVSGAGKFFFGSQALQAIRTLPCPVLVVPSQAKREDIQRIGLISVLVDVETKLPFATTETILNALHAKLYVGHITTGLDYSVKESIDAHRLEKIFGSTPVETHYVRDENFDDGVIKFIELFNIDLLIVVPFRHSFFNRLFHDTHTSRLLKKPFVPMLFVKAVEAE